MIIADSPVDHQSALLAVTPQESSELSQPRSLPNLTIVLAVLGSIVLLLLTVLMVLLCQVNNSLDPLPDQNLSFALQKPREKRNIPPGSTILTNSNRNSKEKQVRPKDGDYLTNFI